MNLETAHIFFPRNYLHSKGYLIGFNISGFLITVIHVEDELKLDLIEKIVNMPYFSRLKKICKGSLMVLGRISEENEVASPELLQKIETANIWINMEIKSKYLISPFAGSNHVVNPVTHQSLSVKGIIVCGYRYKVKTQMILYEKFHKNLLVSLDLNKLKEKLFLTSSLPGAIHSNFGEKWRLQNLIDAFSNLPLKDDFDINCVEILNRIAKKEENKTIENKSHSNSDFTHNEEDLHEMEWTVRLLNMSKTIKKLFFQISEKYKKNILDEQPEEPIQDITAEKDEAKDKTENISKLEKKEEKSNPFPSTENVNQVDDEDQLSLPDNRKSDEDERDIDDLREEHKDDDDDKDNNEIYMNSNKDFLNFPETPQETCDIDLELDTINGTIYRKYLAPKNKLALIILKFFIVFSFLQRIIFDVAYRILKKRIPFFKKSLQDFKVLRTLSNQIKFKLSVIESWPVLINVLVDKHQSLNYSTILKIYLKLLSGICFIMTDTILGILSIFFVLYNVQNILFFVHKYGSGIHIEVLSKEVEWLMGFPAGLKTNKNLNSLMGRTISFFIFFWEGFTSAVTPFEPFLLIMMSICGIFGLTFEMGLASDFIGVFTFHVYYVYIILMKFYHMIVKNIGALYKLMGDKKYSTSKKKNEPYLFKWEQKLIATIIFVFLSSMLPTVAMYYFWFLFIALFIFLVKVFIKFQLHIVNEFPLMLVILYLFDNMSFPRSLVLSLVKKSKKPENARTKKGKDDDISYLILEMQKIPFGFLFVNFFKKIIRANNPPNIKDMIKAVLFGNPINSVNKNDFRNSGIKLSADENGFSVKIFKEDLVACLQI